MSAVLRPPSTVMSAARAAAIVPNALSFPRATMHELVRDRYRVEKLRFDLDAEGRGEILYRLVGGGWAFHFFLVSQKLPEAAKTDRNYAQSWDAMGVLCQGEWSAEREAHLRREVPKQRAGYADYDTLIYARGNRSARVFDHVVDSLAEGRQPDLALVAPIGYILRTTAFIGNGSSVRAPSSASSPTIRCGVRTTRNSARRSCCASTCSISSITWRGHAIRTQHASRPRTAATWASAIRQRPGLRRSSPTIRISCISGASRTRARSRSRRSGRSPPKMRRRFAALLDKAIRYHTEGARPSDGVFAMPQSLAAELARVREAFAAPRADLSWRALCEWAERHASTETCEILNSIALELYPDIADAVRGRLRTRTSASRSCRK